MTSLLIRLAVPVALIGTSATSVAQAGRRASVAPDSVLTADALTRLATFWTTFVNAGDSLWTPRFNTFGTSTPLVAIDTVYTGRRIDRTEWMLNVAVLAAKYPIVKAALTQAGLTPPRYQALFSALLNACRTFNVTSQGDPGTPTTLEAKNIAFLEAHSRAFGALIMIAAHHMLGVGDCGQMARALAHTH
jgi:hypothetical protein